MGILEFIAENYIMLLAIYGAVLSTIALIWKIYSNLQDKPKVKVKANFGFTSSAGGTSGHLLLVTAINKGKRHVYLSSVGLRSGEEDLINIKTIGLPCELKEGSSHSEWFEVNELKDRQFDFAWYRDATGKMYKSRSIKKKLNNYFKSKKIKRQFSTK